MNNSKIQSLLEDFIADFEVKKDTGLYHLKSILFVIKHSNLFNKFLADQLHHNLKDRDEIITKEELLKEFNDPNIRKYNASEYEEVYDFLKGENGEIALKDLLDEQSYSKRQKVEEKLKGSSIDKEALKEIMSIGMKLG